MNRDVLVVVVMLMMVMMMMMMMVMLKLMMMTKRIVVFFVPFHASVHLVHLSKMFSIVLQVPCTA